MAQARDAKLVKSDKAEDARRAARALVGEADERIGKLAGAPPPGAISVRQRQMPPMPRPRGRNPR